MNYIKKYKINALLFLMIIVLLVFSNQIQKKLNKPILKITKEESSFTIDKTFLKIFSLGQKRAISSYLWVYTLLQSDNEHYKKSEGNSWMYIRHNTIAGLDPLFYENYLYGGIYLSIIKDDLEGAADIYEQGLIHYPKDYKLLLNSAFNYYFEIKDHEKGYEKFRILKDHPTTINKHPYLISLIARIGSKLGNLKESFDMLFFLYKNAKSEKIRENYSISLYALKAEFDLSCLNTNQSKCKRVDFFGNPYIYKDGKFQATQLWKKFRPYEKK